MEKIFLKKQDIFKTLNLINEQDEDDWITLSPKELLKILKGVDFNANLLGMYRPLRGKKIEINGDLDLSGLPLKSMGPIKRIIGNLNISKSDIESIDGVTVTGGISDWGSELAKIRERRRIAKLRSEAQSRRENGEWDIDNGDPEGFAAHAVLQYIEDDNPDIVLTQEDKEVLRGLKERLGNLYYDQEQGDESDETQTEIDQLESDISEIEEKIDVYSLIPEKYRFYRYMYMFVVYDGEVYGNEYVAGTSSDTERAALEYAKEYIDEMGPTSFNEWFWEQHLDTEGILDYFRDFYEDDIRNNPEVYFNEDDFELTPEQEARKEQLEEYIEEMESMLSDLEEEQRNLEDSDSDEYYELDEKIQEVQSNIDTAQEELDTIEPDIEPTEEMIDRQVETMLDDVEYDYRAKLDEMGMDISDWIDKDALAEAYVDTDGYGIMNSYDDSYDTIYVDGEEYVVMRIN